MEKFYEPTSYYAFHPVYSGAKHYMVFVSHYSMENGEMQICTYSEKKYSIDSCIQWAYLKLALFEKTNAFHMVVFDLLERKLPLIVKKKLCWRICGDVFRVFRSQNQRKQLLTGLFFKRGPTWKQSGSGLVKDMPGRHCETIFPYE